MSNKVRMECLLAVHCILTVSCFHRQLHLKFRLCFFPFTRKPYGDSKKGRKFAQIDIMKNSVVVAVSTTSLVSGIFPSEEVQPQLNLHYSLRQLITSNRPLNFKPAFRLLSFSHVRVPCAFHEAIRLDEFV